MVKCKHNEQILYEEVLTGRLQIDEHGAIWRVAHRTGVGKKGVTVVTPCERHRGENGRVGPYLRVVAKYDGRCVSVLAHRLVYHHFHGPIPDGLTVNHKNGKKQDNRPDNLELATRLEQAQHAIDVLGTHISIKERGVNHHSAKLTTDQVREIRRRRADGETCISIARDYSIAVSTVSEIARRITRKYE